jgi:hypothetical protein
MATYQIMTDFLGLPKTEHCKLVENDHMASHLNKLKAVKGEQS